MKPSINRSRMEGYHSFRGEGGDYGSFEVIWLDNDDYEAGWYWWACFPGCLPDGDASGPFSTSRLAWKDARND